VPELTGAGSSESPDQEVIVRLERIFTESLGMAVPAPEVDIIETGMLDSLALVTLLFEIEQEFGVEIPLESLEIEDFRCVADIGRMLTKAVSTP
jgi:acyl carrier protein